MNKITQFFKDKFVLLAAILLSIYLLGDIFGNVGYFMGNGGDITAGIFFLVIDIALVALFVVVFVAKKWDVLKLLLLIMLIAFAYDSFRGFPGSFVWFGAGNGWLVTYGVFEVTLLSVVAVLFVLYVISLFSDKLSAIQTIVKIAALVVIPLSMATGLIYIIALAVNNGFWASYLETIGQFFAFIPLMAITYLAYFHKDAPASEKKAEPKEEPKEEKPEESK